MTTAKRPLPPSSGNAAKRPNLEDEMVDYEQDLLEADLDEGDIDIPSLEDLQADDIDMAEAGRNWERPLPAPIDPLRESLVFQQFEVDYIQAAPEPQFWNVSLPRVPVVRMFGVTEKGHSICAFVHGFLPYFYVACPARLSAEDAASFHDSLNKALAQRSGKNIAGGQCVVQVTPEMKTSIWHYRREGPQLFYRVVVALPNLVTTARGILEGGLFVPSCHETFQFETYESNVLFALRFMIDSEIQGANWVEFPAGRYKLVTDSNFSNGNQYSMNPASVRLSHCQLEAHIRYDSIISHAAEGAYSKLAPFRILSFDIECAGRKGHFPEPKMDPVIQIASVLTVQGESEPHVQNVLTLKSCAAIAGAEVLSFENEADMIMRWRDLVQKTDPDIIIGYNICNFDLPYLLERAEHLKLDKFPLLGRIRGSKSRMKESQFSSKQYGTHGYKDITIEGRVQFDMLLAIQRDYKLSSYSLNSVSAHFLGEQKEDVHHSIISDLQNGNAETRRRLAVYCLKDARLPQLLIDKLMYMYNYVEMARVTGVPMSFLLTRGQSVKVFCQILRKARVKGFVVPFKKTGAQSDGVAYEGATVLHAQTGFHTDPIATLDFASLYPSIMMAHNLCYSTLIPQHMAKNFAPEELTKTPAGDYFVKPSIQKGILPEILQELLGARKRAKADLKAAKDPFVKAVLDGRQLALKVSANSVYGFTGATVGKMPCLEISASVTSFGREMINHTKNVVEGQYNRKNGYEMDCEVIYGDTDSVMVKFKVSDLARAMDLGRQAAEFITKSFPPPVKLEFEKVYYPYLLMSKKKYAGLLWTKPETWDKMDSKGIETVRRDNCLLVRNVIETCLQNILIDRDVNAAVEYVKATITDLLMNRMDMSLLVVSKSLATEVDAYKATTAHVELVKRMRKRDPVTAPAVGDRVPYVMIKAAKGAKAHEKAEDPIYALENNIPIDAQYYLDHHLSQPLLRIFEPVLGEKKAKSLLVGDHTRSIIVTTPTGGSGIMGFVKKQLKCMNCKAVLDKGRTTMCQHCEEKISDIYQRTLTSVNDLEQLFSRLWTQCQRCQGSLHQDVLCTNRDCPIFYRRKKVQRDLEDAHTSLARFADW